MNPLMTSQERAATHAFFYELMEDPSATQGELDEVMESLATGVLPF